MDLLLHLKDIGVVYLVFALFLILIDYSDDFLNYLIPVAPKTTKLNPWWITGFVDAEGSFQISPRGNNWKYKI